MAVASGAGSLVAGEGAMLRSLAWAAGRVKLASSTMDNSFAVNDCCIGLWKSRPADRIAGRAS